MLSVQQTCSFHLTDRLSGFHRVIQMVCRDNRNLPFCFLSCYHLRDQAWSHLISINCADLRAVAHRRWTGPEQHHEAAEARRLHSAGERRLYSLWSSVYCDWKMKSQIILVCWKLHARNYSRLIVAKVRLGMTGEKFQRKANLAVWLWNWSDWKNQQRLKGFTGFI